MNEPYRLRYANQIVGFFLLILLVSLTVLGIALTSVSRVLVKPDRYYAKLTEDEAADLRPGTEVIVLGRRIGQVESINYAEQGNLVLATLAIDPEQSHFLTSESELRLERKFGLGTPILRVQRRSVELRQEPVQPLPPNSEIARFQGEVDRVDQMAREVEQVGDSIGKIEKQMNPTLSSIGVAAEQLTQSLVNQLDPAATKGQSAFQSLERTSEEIRPETVRTLEMIRGTTERLEREMIDLTERVKHVVEKDIPQTLLTIQQSAAATTNAAQAVTKTTSGIDNKSEKTNQEIAATLKVIRDTAKSIQQLSNETRDVVQVLQREVNELPGTAERVQSTVGDTQDLVQEIRSHWLLRRTKREPTPTEQISPSSIRSGGP